MLPDDVKEADEFSTQELERYSRHIIERTWWAWTATH